MVNFLFWFFTLSIPFVFLLFLSSSKRKKILYSHFFLKSIKFKKLPNKLFIVLLLYYDLLLDFLIIILLSLILSNVNILKTGNKIAFIIDSSYSIKKENYKDFYDYLKNNNNFYNDIYILSYNIKKGKNRLFKIKDKSIFISFNSFFSYISKNFVHFNNNYNEIYTLFSNLHGKYKKIIFLTDFFPFKNTNIYTFQTNFHSEIVFYPINLYYNIFSNTFEVYLQKTDSSLAYLNNTLFEIFKLEYNKSFSLKPFTNYKIIIENPLKLKIVFNMPGIYVLKEGKINFILKLKQPQLNIVSTSKFIENIVTLFNNLNLTNTNNINSIKSNKNHFDKKSSNNNNLKKNKNSIIFYYFETQLDQPEILKNNNENTFLINKNIENKLKKINNQNSIIFIKPIYKENNNNNFVFYNKFFYYYLNPETTLNNYFHQIYLNHPNKNIINNLKNIIIVNNELTNSTYYPYIILNYLLNLTDIYNNNSYNKFNNLTLFYKNYNSFIYKGKFSLFKNTLAFLKHIQYIFTQNNINNKFFDKIVIENLDLNEFIKPTIKNNDFIIISNNKSKYLFFFLLIIVFLLKTILIFKATNKRFTNNFVQYKKKLKITNILIFIYSYKKHETK